MMSNRFTCIGVCLLSLLLAACGNRTIHAPVSSRSHDRAPPPVVLPERANIASSYADDEDAVHVVSRGDTLSSIARRYGMGYKDLARINAIPIPYKLHVGQRIRLAEDQDAGTVVIAAPVRTPAKVTPEAVEKPVTEPVEQQPVTVSVEEAPAAETSEVIEFDGNWQWPTRGRLLRGFKPNEPGKKGIFIGGHNGQPVKAAANGKVVYVGSGLVGYGRLIIIRHNDELLSTYGHNSEMLVTEGEYVKAGQTIAKMGSSSTGRNELYFEIRKEGKPVDPSTYLPKEH